MMFFDRYDDNNKKKVIIPTMLKGLSKVAQTGDYDDLINKPINGDGSSSGGNVTIGTTNITCGGIPANTAINNIPNQELWKKLLVQDLAPIVTLTGNVPTTIREIGDEITINFTSKAERRNDKGDIISVKLASNPTATEFDFEDNTPDPKLNNYTRSNIKIDNTTTFQTVATDSLGKVGKASLTYTFVRPIYCGLVSEDINGNNIIAETITNNSTKTLQTRSKISATLTTPAGKNRKFFFAYEKAWGNAASIIDVANGFDLIGNCTKVEVDIECLDGEVVTYICYIANIGGQYIDKTFALNFSSRTVRNETNGILLTDEANNDKYILCVDSGDLYLRKIGD